MIPMSDHLTALQVSCASRAPATFRRAARELGGSSVSDVITSSTCGYGHRLENIQKPGVTGSRGGFSLDCFEIQETGLGRWQAIALPRSDVRSIHTRDVLGCEKIIDVGHEATGAAQPLARTIRVQLQTDSERVVGLTLPVGCLCQRA